MGESATQTPVVVDMGIAVGSLVRSPRFKGRLLRVPSSSRQTPGGDEQRRFSGDTRLRGEAQAPFRKFRKFIWVAGGMSALIGTGTATLQLVAKLAGAPRPPATTTNLTNIAIDAAAAAVLFFLWRREDRLDERQLDRISKEERLAELQVKLESGKTASLRDLREFSRVVIIAGPNERVREAVANARNYRPGLEKRAALIVPVPFTEEDGNSGMGWTEPQEGDLRFYAQPLLLDRWRKWIEEQMAAAGIASRSLVHLCLSLEGRVIASGTGEPPWRGMAGGEEAGQA